MVKLWFGPKGTVTPLHYDLHSILFMQIYGRKRVKLIPSFDTPKVYLQQRYYSAVDPENVDSVETPEISPSIRSRCSGGTWGHPFPARWLVALGSVPGREHLRNIQQFFRGGQKHVPADDVTLPGRMSLQGRETVPQNLKSRIWH